MRIIFPCFLNLNRITLVLLFGEVKKNDDFFIFVLYNQKMLLFLQAIAEYEN
jgi:hypothetical protein